MRRASAPQAPPERLQALWTPGQGPRAGCGAWHPHRWVIINVGGVGRGGGVGVSCGGEDEVGAASRGCGRGCSSGTSGAGRWASAGEPAATDETAPMTVDDGDRPRLKTMLSRDACGGALGDWD